MIEPVMAISNLVLTQQIYSEETNGAHAHYGEPVPLSQNVTHRIRVVKKYQDSYHCGRWLHHHNSRSFHVGFYSVKQSLTPTTYFFMF